MAPAHSPTFSAHRARGVLEDLVACGPKYVGYSEQCGLQVLQGELERIIREERGLAEVDLPLDINN